VIKAELTTKEDIDSDKPYMFPDNDDNMTSFTGKSAQVMLPNELLKGVLSQLPPSKIAMQYISCMCYILFYIDTTEFAITNFVIRNNSISLPSPSNG